MRLAVRAALECLKMFEMTFPERPTDANVRHEYNRLRQMASQWTPTIDDALVPLDSADRTAAQTGEVVFACISAQHRVTNLLARGDRLDLIWPESINSLTFVRKKGYAHIVDSLLAI